MKLYRLLFFGIFLYCSDTVSAQTKITFGTPYDMVDNEDGAEELYFEKDNELLSVKIFGSKVVIEKMNLNKLTQTSMQTYKDFPKERGLNFSELKEINGRFYVFYFLYEPISAKDELYAREIDFKSGTFKDSGNKVFTLTRKVKEISYVASSDGSKLLIQLRPEYKFREVQGRTFYNMEIYVFDPSLSLIWSKDVEIPHTEIQMDQLFQTVDSKGNVYHIRRVYPNANQADYLELIKIEAVTGAVRMTRLNNVGRTVTEAMVIEKPSGQVMCAGFYKNNSNAATVEGAFLSEISAEGNLENSQFYGISADVLNQGINERSLAFKIIIGAPIEVQNRLLKKILVEPDGSLLIIGQHEYIEESIRANYSGAASPSYTFHYDDIVIIKVDADGKLNWMTGIPKRQLGLLNPGTLSYVFSKSEKNYCFYFMDNKKNNALMLNTEPATFRNGHGILTLYLVNQKTGASQRMPVTHTEDVQGTPLRRFTPEKRIIIAENKNYSLIENYKGKRQDQLIKISWEE